MKTGRLLLIILGMTLIFLFVVKIAEASTAKAYKNEIIPIKNISSEAEDYPVINEIESKVLGGSYPKEDIYNRLSRLETKIFGSVSKKSLSDRVEDLSKRVIGENNTIEEDDDNYSPPNSTDSESYNKPSDDNSLNNLLNQLEKKLLNQVYPNDTNEERVARLEKYIFNGSSESFPMNERLERLASVVKAQPSDEIVQDANQLGNSQMIGKGLSLATIILMIVAGLLL